MRMLQKKIDKSTETDFMDDNLELPESGPLTEKKKIHTKKPSDSNRKTFVELTTISILAVYQYVGNWHF